MKPIAIVSAILLVVLFLPDCSVGQELPTATPEDVGVSSEKVGELSKLMQLLTKHRREHWHKVTVSKRASSS